MADIQANLHGKFVVDEFDIRPGAKAVVDKWLTSSSGRAALAKGGAPESEDTTKKLTSSLVGAFVSVNLLNKTIHAAISQSKIIGVVTSSISKALGLLVDLILMPFLPLIVWGIIKLYEAIMLWNRTYDPNAWDTTDLESGMLGLTNVFAAFPLLLGIEIGKQIGQWLIDHVVSPVIEAVDNFFPGFKEAWDAFWSNPLESIKMAWVLFMNWVSRLIQDTWYGLNNILLTIPFIKDIFAAAGGKHITVASDLNPAFAPTSKYMGFEGEGTKEAAPEKIPAVGSWEAYRAGGPAPGVTIINNFNGNFLTENDLRDKIWSITEQQFWIKQQQVK